MDKASLAVDQIIALHKLARFDIDHKATLEAIRICRTYLECHNDNSVKHLLSLLVAFKQWQNEATIQGDIFGTSM